MTERPDSFEQLAEALRSTHGTDTPFGTLVGTADFDVDAHAGVGFHESGMWAHLGDVFNPRMTGNEFATELTGEERDRVLEDLLAGADRGDVPVSEAAEYADLSAAVDGMDGATHLLLPTAPGRPMRVHEERERTEAAGTGLSSVTVSFVDAENYELDRAVLLDAAHLTVVRKTAADLDLPGELADESVRHLSDPDDYVDVYKVAEGAEASVHVRTVYSGVRGIDADHVRVLELPD
jgi:hypothetical protein